jgi:hypothetical protein
MPIVEALAIAGSIAAIVSGFKDGLSLFRNWRKKRMNLMAGSERNNEVALVEQSLQQKPHLISSRYEESLRTLGLAFAQGDGELDRRTWTFFYPQETNFHVAEAHVSLIKILMSFNKTLVDCLKLSISDSFNPSLPAWFDASETSGHAVILTLGQLHQRLLVAAPIQHIVLTPFKERRYTTTAPLPPSDYPDTAELLCNQLRAASGRRLLLTPFPVASPSPYSIDALKAKLSQTTITAHSGFGVPALSTCASQNVLTQNIMELHSLSFSTPVSQPEIRNLQPESSSSEPGHRREEFCHTSTTQSWNRAPVELNAESDRTRPGVYLYNTESEPMPQQARRLSPSFSELPAIDLTVREERQCPTSLKLCASPSLSIYPLILPEGNHGPKCQSCSSRLHLQPMTLNLHGLIFILSERYLAKNHLPSAAPGGRALLGCPLCQKTFQAPNLWALHLEEGHQARLMVRLFEADADATQKGSCSV